MPLQTHPRFIDLIMKGGITSGIVYPPAICRIAQDAYLHGIGGTSAGAIGACFAAAAEYRRRQNLDTPESAMDGYDMLSRLPHELGAEGRLLSLFAADKSTHKLFELIKRETGLTQPTWAATRWYRTATAWPRYLRYFIRKQAMLQPLIDNHLGLCTGMANDVPRDENALPLTVWLSEQLNEVAGLERRGRPLTFGDLWDAPVPDKLKDFLGEGSYSIDLKMISTCLTYGKPYTLPLTDKRFMFDPSQFRRLFPAEVCEYLEAVAREIGSKRAEHVGKLPLPTGSKMPVVVAMRMSLSFPLLFSMVPLWTRSREIDSESAPAILTYFMDGGVTSNLPIHFFDAPLPRWPTLAINLQYRRKGYRTERHPDGIDKLGLFIPQDNTQAIDPLYHQVDVGDPLLDSYLQLEQEHEESNSDRLKRLKKNALPTTRLLGLASSIFRAAQTWNDCSYTVLSGYRQRVAELWLDPSEGGMNLSMDSQTIQQLIRKGENVGEQLALRFDPKKTGKMSWEDHRWVRMRGSMAAVARMIHDIKRGLRMTLPPDADYRSLIRGDLGRNTAAGDQRSSYRMNQKTQRDDALALLDKLEQLANELSQMSGALKPGEDPRSRPFSSGPVPGVDLKFRAAEKLAPTDEDHRAGSDTTDSTDDGDAQ